MKKNELSSLHILSNVKVFATQDGRPVCRKDTTYYIDPFDTHVDQ